MANEPPKNAALDHDIKFTATVPQTRTETANDDFPSNLLAVIFKTDAATLLELPENVCTRLYEILDLLGDRSKQIILMRFQSNMTLSQIGNEFHLSRERIRQILNKNIRKLQHPTRKKQLLDSSISIKR